MCSILKLSKLCSVGGIKKYVWRGLHNNFKEAFTGQHFLAITYVMAVQSTDFCTICPSVLIIAISGV